MPSATDFRRAFGLEAGTRIEARGGAAVGGKRRRGGAASPPQPTSFELVSVSVGHEAVRRNERYAFPTELVLAPVAGAGTTRRGRSSSATGDNVSAATNTRDAATAALRDALRDRHMVYSAYGSPYECAYDLGSLRLYDASSAKDASDVAPPPGAWRATVTGVATRRRDVPTKAQEHDAAQHAGGAEDAKQERARVRAEAKARGLRVVTSRFGSSVCAACGAAIEHGELIARSSDAAAAGDRGGWAHAACAMQPRAPRSAHAS